MRHVQTLRPGFLDAHQGPPRARPALGAPLFVTFREPDGLETAFAAWLIARDEEQRLRRVHAPAFRVVSNNPAVEQVFRLSRSYPPTVVATRSSYPPSAA
jgi:hypothetical protein